MNPKSSSLRQQFGRVWSFVGLLLFPLLPALAQTPKANPLIYNAPKPPPDQGAPTGRRQGGASRGSCREYETLTALIPQQDGTVVGATRSAEPTFWFYIPSPLTPDVTLEFVLQDRADNYVYRTETAIATDSAGLIPISVRPPESSIKLDHTYHWTLSIYCDPDRPSSSVFVRGLMHRIQPPELSETPSLPPLQQATEDARNGAWFESLTTLAELRQTEPHNSEIETAWFDLLRQGELEHLTSAPVLQQPTAQQASR